MSRADRAFLGLALVSLGAGSVLALPLVLTLFPAALHRALHGAEGFVRFCDAVLAGLGLPPLGTAVLALTAATILLGTARAFAITWRTHRALARQRPVAVPARVRRAARRAGIQSRMSCFDDERPRAFCAGVLRPRAWISTGAARRLGRRGLEAVLWHESYHIRRRDPLRLAVARVLRAGLFAVPLVGALAERFEVERELDADEAALRAQGGPRPLAGALLELSPDRPHASWAVGALSSLSRARVDQICGRVEVRRPLLPARAAWLSAGTRAVALLLAAGQAARAQLVPAVVLGAIRTTAPVEVGTCPLPPEGILL